MTFVVCTVVREAAVLDDLRIVACLYSDVSAFARRVRPGQTPRQVLREMKGEAEMQGVTLRFAVLRPLVCDVVEWAEQNYERVCLEPPELVEKDLRFKAEVINEAQDTLPPGVSFLDGKLVRDAAPGPGLPGLPRPPRIHPD